MSEECANPDLHKVDAVRVEERKLLLRWGVIAVVLVGVLLGVAAKAGTPVLAAAGIAVWFAGAAALGLLTGFVTGASEKEGTAGQLLNFVSSGVIVPVLGGFAALLQQVQTTTESYTYGVSQVTQKVVEVASRAQPQFLSPMLVAGGFFCFYSICAVWGIGLGVRRRNTGSGNPSGGIRMASQPRGQDAVVEETITRRTVAPARR